MAIQFAQLNAVNGRLAAELDSWIPVHRVWCDMLGFVCSNCRYLYCALLRYTVTAAIQSTAVLIHTTHSHTATEQNVYGDGLASLNLYACPSLGCTDNK